MTVTVLDATPAQADPGRVTEANPTRPDPEVPERAHRRTLTARYKLDVQAAYDAADPGEKGAPGPDRASSSVAVESRAAAPLPSGPSQDWLTTCWSVTSVTRPRRTFSRMDSAVAVQTSGLGWSLVTLR